MKKLTIYLLFCILFSFSVIAAPPIRTSISAEVGLDISYPQLNYYPNTTSVDYVYFRWWVYNISDGVLLTNNSLNCTFYLLDNTGRNTYRADMRQVGYSLGYPSCINCFYINVSKSNFTYYGGYYYQIRCFPSSGIGNYGGYISQYFAYINNLVYNSLFGEENTSSTAIILIFVILVGLFCFFGYIFWKEQNFTFYFSYLFWYLALLMPLIAIRILIQLNSLNANMTTLLENTFRIYLIFYCFMLIMLILIFFVIMMQWLIPSKVPMWKRKKGDM